MSKGLEALKEIKICNYYEDDECIDDDYLSIGKYISIIEKELKEYEEIKTYMQQYEIEDIEELRRVLHNDWVARQKFKTDNANIINAFEIIKEKRVWVAYLSKCDTCEDYNNGIFDFGKENHLTQEEYELLKGVLLC